LTTQASDQVSPKGLKVKSIFDSVKAMLLDHPEIFLLLVLMAVLLVLKPTFFTVKNIINILRQASVIGIVTCAVTLIIISGYMDLSVGSIVTLTAVTVVYAVANGIVWWLAILLGFGVALLAGLVNSFAINVLNGNFIVVTLSTQTIFQGIALIIARGTYIIIPEGDPILFIGKGKILGIPMPIVFFALVALGLHIFLTKTRFGRDLYFIGVNARAAGLSGIPVKLYRGALYLVTAFFSALGGIIISTRVSSTSTAIGKGFDFDAITAAVLGGVYLSGGKGSIPQAVLGVIILAMLANAQTLLGVQVYTQYIVKGVVLALVVSFQEMRRRS
jgi:ribose transport system permease protein